MEELATLGGGCFWCTEAIFKRLKGVSSVIPGYSGGADERSDGARLRSESEDKRGSQGPTYEEVHTGTTGHAESIQITFDPSILPYEKILDVFWHTHNPTTKNRQGADEGEEYRSVIFYHSEKQKQIAEKSKQDVEKSGLYKDPIVTEIVPFDAFYPAESQHKDFYEKNQNSPYCMFVIDPKIQKLLKEFGNDVKEEYK